jgi:predicted ATP-grasp superfamily ATP-dependent carboligase
MQILVHEFVSGGGLSGQPVPTSLAREGLAMLTALVEDLAAIGGHQIVTTVDPRFLLPAPPGVQVVTLSPEGGATFDALVAAADAVWLVAPETNRCLERLAAKVERAGTTLLGSGATATRRASDKARLPRLLARLGIPHPKTRVFHPDLDGEPVDREVGYPLVVKPARGAGCDGVCLVRNERELGDAVDLARSSEGDGALLLQRYVTGTAASVSLLADGQRAVVLTVNSQSVDASTPFSYRGGQTPFDHPLAEKAAANARRTCEALSGLRGFIGVDLVLTDSEAVVIEVNPRLTTAYLGVRAAIGGNNGRGENVAAMALAACAGSLPPPPLTRRSVRFSAAGLIHEVAPSSSAPVRP